MSHSHLRFVVCILGLTCMMASCAHHDRHGGAGVDYSKFVFVATISGDPDLASRLDHLLAKQGIGSIIEGSVVYGVQVAPDQREKAIKILKADSERQGYWIKFDGAT